MSVAVMLATLTDRRDFGDGWLLERKFDGERFRPYRSVVARYCWAAVSLFRRGGTDPALR